MVRLSDSKHELFEAIKSFREDYCDIIIEDIRTSSCTSSGYVQVEYNIHGDKFSRVFRVGLGKPPRVSRDAWEIILEDLEAMHSDKHCKGIMIGNPSFGTIETCPAELYAEQCLSDFEEASKIDVYETAVQGIAGMIADA